MGKEAGRKCQGCGLHEFKYIPVGYLSGNTVGAVGCLNLEVERTPSRVTFLLGVV